jgi:hypothetical protein
VHGSLLPIVSSSALRVSYNPTDDTYPHVYEQALDRLAFAFGGKAVCACNVSAHPAGIAPLEALACGAHGDRFCSGGCWQGNLTMADG